MLADEMKPDAFVPNADLAAATDGAVRQMLNDSVAQISDAMREFEPNFGTDCAPIRATPHYFSCYSALLDAVLADDIDIALERLVELRIVPDQDHSWLRGWGDLGSDEQN